MADTPKKTSPKTVIHVGLHKTGTSTLQKFFRSLDSIQFIERVHVQAGFVGADVLPDPAVFDKSEAEAYEKNRVLVMSHERLSGYPASGGFDREQIATRLATRFPQAKILMVFREQTSWTRSFYQQYISEGGSESIADFLSNPWPQIYKMPRFERSYLDYFAMYALYQNQFGAGNVFALPYEMMVRDFSSFSERLNAFFKVDLQLENEVVNKSRPLGPLILLRNLNGTMGKTQLSPGGFIPLGYLKKFAKICGAIPGARVFDDRIKQNWHEEIAESFGDYYKSSNAQIAQVTGLDLASYGYEV